VVSVWLQERQAGRLFQDARCFLAETHSVTPRSGQAGPERQRGACRDRGGGLCPRSRGAPVSATTLAYFTHASS